MADKKERVDALLLQYSIRQIAEKLDDVLQQHATCMESALRATETSETNRRIVDVVEDWLTWRKHMHADGTLGTLDRFLDELRDAKNQRRGYLNGPTPSP